MATGGGACGEPGTAKRHYERGNDRLYVQVAYIMESEETQRREFAALEAVPDNFPKMVLSLDRFNLSSGGIVHRYLPDFLAQEDI